MSKAKNKRFSFTTTIAVISAIAAVASALFAYYQTTVVRKQMYVHIEPKVSLDLNIYNYKKRYLQPVLIIRNLSPINIVSVGADYQFLNFSKSQRKFVWKGSSLTGDQLFQRYPLYEKKLEPNDFIAAELGDVIEAKKEKTLGNVFIFVIFCDYYRQSDMQKFSRREVFFYVDGRLLRHSQFLSDPSYDDIFTTVQNAEPTSHESLDDMPGDLILNKFNEIKKGMGSKETSPSKESLKKSPAKQPAQPSRMRLQHNNE